MPDDAPFSYTRKVVSGRGFDIGSTLSTSPKELSASDGQTPLIAAANSGSIAAICLLLSKGAKVDLPDARGCTALYHAVCRRHKAAAAQLLAAGADPGIICKSGANALHAAAYDGILDIVELLMSLDRSDLMTVDGSGRTPVAYAAAEGHLDCTKAISRGRKLTPHCEAGVDKAFVLAFENGHHDVVEFLTSFYGIDVVAPSLPSSLAQAARIGHMGIVRGILDCGKISEKDLEIAIEEAAKHGHQAILELLWSLQSAEKKGHLIEESTTWTSLMWASNAGHALVVNFLLGAGCDPNSTSPEGFTPLIGAAACGWQDTTAALLAHGAEPNKFTSAGSSAVILAARNGHTSIVRALLEAGADPESKTTSGDYTALMFAAKNGHDEIIKLLLGYQVSVDASASDGFTALALAAQNGRLSCAKTLLEAGADKNLGPRLDSWYEERRTPLLLAVERGHEDVVELLLSVGANIEHDDPRQCTPIEIAAYAGNERMVAGLLDAGAKRQSEVFTIAYDMQHKGILGRLMVDGIDAAKVLDSRAEKDDWRYRGPGRWTPPEDVEIYPTEEFTVWPSLEWAICDKIVGRLLDPNLDVTSVAWSEWSDLIWAADLGKLEEVKTLLKDGTNVNAAVSNGHTALMSAAANGHVEVCHALLTHGADPNACASGCTALLLAARNGHADIVAMLLVHGADADWKADSRDQAYESEDTKDTGWGAYLLAAYHGHTAVLQALPEPKSRFNEEVGDRMMYSVAYPIPDLAIYFAASRGHDDTVRYLISRGAHINIQAHGGERPITEAARNGYLTVVSTLLGAGAIYIIESSDGWRLPSPSALIQAVQNGHQDVVELLLRSKPSYPENTKAIALSEACSNGDHSMVMALIRAGTDPAAIPMGRRHPIASAVESQKLAILETVIEASNGREGTHGFFRYGLAIDASDAAGITALLTAAQLGRLDMVQTLLKAGADINIPDSSGWSALMTAAWKGHREVVRFLLSQGCKINVTDRHERSALTLACGIGDIEMIQDLIDAGANVAPRSKFNTPLITATKKNHTSVAKVIISAGADINYKLPNNATALIEASWRNHAEMVHLLLDAGACVGAALWDEWTSLALASRDGHVDVVRALMTAGADPNVVVSAGYTPMALAARHGHLAVVEHVIGSANYLSEPHSYALALLDATRQGHTPIVDSLLQHEASHMTNSSICEEALRAATRAGFEKMAKCIQQHMSECVQQFGVHSSPKIVPVDTKAKDSKTDHSQRHKSPASTTDVPQIPPEPQNPLFNAIAENNNNLAQKLLEAADHPFIGRDGSTALHIAARHENLAMIEWTLQRGLDVNFQIHEGLYGEIAREQPNLPPPPSLVDTKADESLDQYLEDVRNQCSGLNPLLCKDCLSMIPSIADLDTHSVGEEKRLAFVDIFNSALRDCPGCAMALSYLFAHYDTKDLWGNIIHRAVITHEKGVDGGVGETHEVQSLFDDGQNRNRTLRFDRDGAGLDDQTATDIQNRFAQRKKVDSESIWDFQTLIVKYRLGENDTKACRFIVYASEGMPSSPLTHSERC